MRLPILSAEPKDVRDVLNERTQQRIRKSLRLNQIPKLKAKTRRSIIKWQVEFDSERHLVARASVA